MTLLPVEEALARIVAGVVPDEAEAIPLAEATGRFLAAPLIATRDQPPFDASSMDGFAVRAAGAMEGATLRIIGESAAGKRFAGALGPGEAIIVNTGAPMPPDADAVLIKEKAAVEGDSVIVQGSVERGRYIRPAGLDFRAGDTLLRPGASSVHVELALTAAAGFGSVSARRRPRVAFLSIGDELVSPGALPGPDQITAASAVALAAMARKAGAEAVDLGIVRDDARAVAQAIISARGTDVFVTIGGASVGAHDVVHDALAAVGATREFWRIAMRPGRPMLFGGLGAMRIFGLPGNPVSSLVCSLMFLMPLIRALLGAPPIDPTEPAIIGADVAANDDRQDYLRAALDQPAESLLIATPFARQDSAMLRTLAAADCLIVRPPNAPAAKAGQSCRIIRLP